MWGGFAITQDRALAHTNSTAVTVAIAEQPIAKTR
jgi:hypothetical protein